MPPEGDPTVVVGHLTAKASGICLVGALVTGVMLYFNMCRRIHRNRRAQGADTLPGGVAPARKKGGAAKCRKRLLGVHIALSVVSLVFGIVHT
eukprot:g14172.t1